MDYPKLISALKAHDKQAVNNYCSYIQNLIQQKKKDGGKWIDANPWASRVSSDVWANMFNKVASLGLFIDGDVVLLQNRGKLEPVFSYQAYKNLVMIKYPESTFDVQLVRQGDDFSFSKVDGSVHYTHKFGDPFGDKKVLGAYVVIKNKRGEFLELTSKAEIDKMKSKSKTNAVWDEWFSEMALKSAIKRACKRHFKDITQDVDTVDNEQYDLEEKNTYVEQVKNLPVEDAIDELRKIYKQNNGNQEQQNLIMEAVNELQNS